MTAIGYGELMVASSGFWSYVHADDEAEGGRIVRLGRDVVAAHRLQTGETIDLFVDKQIEWGEDWEDRIDETLATVAFFIPIITPGYFSSPQCRRELNFFARRADALGVSELIMPILYVDVPALHDDASLDDAVRLIAKYQWEDWRELRFADFTSSEYRRAVSRMADRIAAANKSADESTSVTVLTQSDEVDNNELGLLDRLGILEQAMPDWSETMSEINKTVLHIGEVTQDAARDMQAASKKTRPMAARLTLAKQLSTILNTDASRLETLTEKFTSGLHDVDTGIRAVIEMAPSQASPDDKEAVDQFFNTVRELVASAEDGLGSFAGLADSIRPVEGLSRDLRAPLQRIRKSATVMEEGRDVTRGWLPLIDANPFGDLERLA